MDWNGKDLKGCGLALDYPDKHFYIYLNSNNEKSQWGKTPNWSKATYCGIVYQGGEQYTNIRLCLDCGRNLGLEW